MNLSEDVLVGIAGIAIALIGFSGVVTAFLRRGSPETILLSQKAWSVITVIVLLATLSSSLGLVPWHQFTFLLGLALGIGVSLQNFYLLLFPSNRLQMNDLTTDAGGR